jgi:lipoprotein signal peptidase
LASLVGIVVLGFWASRGAGRLERSGAAVAAAGAAGNLLDRLVRSPGVLHGGVVDWIHVSFYGPTFNLADLWLRGGILVAAASWLWHQRQKRPGWGLSLQLYPRASFRLPCECHELVRRDRRPDHRRRTQGPR